MDHRIKLYIEKTGILLAVYLLLKYLLPLVFPFFLAWLTVSLLASASRHFHRKLLPFTASVVAMFFFFTAAALKLTGWLLLEPCKDLIPELQTQLQTWINEYADLADWIPSSLSLHLSTAVPPVLSCAFGIFLYFMAVILFAHDWPDFQRLLTHLPFARPLEHAGKRIAQSLKGWAHAQIRIMFVIVLECTVGYWLLHIPGAGLWAVLTGMVDALPVFGTGTIFVPWLILVFCQKGYTFFVWLLLLYGITWLTRELLEPKLLGDGLGLLPVCFLISVIVGLKLFGAAGLFTGPFGILFVKELWTELEMWDSLQTPSASRCGDEKR